MAAASLTRAQLYDQLAAAINEQGGACFKKAGYVVSAVQRLVGGAWRERRVELTRHRRVRPGRRPGQRQQSRTAGHKTY